MAGRKRKRPTSRLDWLARHRGRAFAAVALAVALAIGNWFAHLPTETRALAGPAELTLEALGAVTADATDAIGLTGHDAWVDYAKAPALGPLPFGVPRVVDPGKTPDDLVLLKRKGYWVGYSPSLRRPVWAAYAVPEARVLRQLPDRPPFERDPEVRDSPVTGSYTGSGYDRGHLAPNYAIATCYGREAQRETFLMTNIAPQAPELNRGPWRILEAIVADDLPPRAGTVWAIVCLTPGGKTLKKGGIDIPAGFGLVLASWKAGRLRAIGLYMPQETADTKRPRYCFRSVRWLEEQTGLDFFPALSQVRQDALETVEANRFWPRWELF